MPTLLQLAGSEHLRQLSLAGKIDTTSELNGVIIPLPALSKQREAVAGVLPSLWNAGINRIDVGKIVPCTSCRVLAPMVQMKFLAMTLFLDDKETFLLLTYLEKRLLPGQLCETETRVVEKMVCDLCAEDDVAVLRADMRATWTALHGPRTARKVAFFNLDDEEDEAGVSLDDIYDCEMELQRGIKRAMKDAGFEHSGGRKKVAFVNLADISPMRPLRFD